MRAKLLRYMSMLRIGGILIILAILGIVAYQVYDFYSERLGYTATRAIDDYFTALSTEDYDTVYQMTDRASLMDIYGRSITRSEFITQLRRLAGDEPFPFEEVEATKLFETRTHHYYEVLLHSNVGGAAGQSRLILEMQRTENSWVITYPFAIVL